jgi:hypothetical protein
MLGKVKRIWAKFTGKKGKATLKGGFSSGTMDLWFS